MSHAINCPMARGEQTCICAPQTTTSAADSYHDTPDEFGFPRTKYLGELPFVWQFTAGKLQVYRPDDFNARNNPGPIGFIPASALTNIIADLANLANLASVIEDGFGNEWGRCERGSDCRLEIVRPGSVQCNSPRCPDYQEKPELSEAQESPSTLGDTL